MTPPDLFASLGIGVIGYFVGNVLFTSVLRWVATVHEIASEQKNGR